MLELLFAFALCGGTYLALRGGFAATNGFTIAGYDTQSMGIGLLAILAAGYLFGPLYGVAIIFSVMIHEFGHVAAYWIAGHRDARFRLIPLMGGVAISNHAPATQEKAFFISLMGPGICLAPMVTAYVLCTVLYDAAPLAAEFLWTFAVATGALNFFNLLPFWPLDGGRCVRIIAGTFAPGSTRLVTLAMSGAMAAAAVYMQSLLLFMFALMGTQGMMQAENLSRVQRRMSRPRGALCAAAYAFTAAAHFSVGWPFLSGYL
jgi:Zn-dependent protease